MDEQVAELCGTACGERVPDGLYGRNGARPPVLGTRFGTSNKASRAG